MSDWTLLNQNRIRAGLYASEDSDGFNGMFRLTIAMDYVRCLASDGGGWQHVSVSLVDRKHPPRWRTVCAVKDLFWEPEDWVVQYHPAQSQYLNYHPGCLHLWRPLEAVLPTPPPEMVGPRSKLLIN